VACASQVSNDIMNAAASSPSTSSFSPRSAAASEGAEGPRARVADLVGAVVRFARARPYAALGAAMLAGFAVGGALSWRGGRVMLTAGMKQAGSELLKQLL
jgi:dienelactone hydrolase